MSYRHRPGYMPWDRTGNRVLVQSELGRNKPTNYQIPEESHLYGKNTYMDAQKANNLMYDWSYHKNSSNKNEGKVKDLIQTNKAALQQMIHTAPGNSSFRKSQTQYKQPKKGSNYIKIKLPQQNFTYGKPLDTEDPIKLVIRNDYGQTDKMFRHTMYQLKKDNEQQIKTRLSFHKTKNHNLLKQVNDKRIALFDWANRDNLKQKWKMNKFSLVQGRTDTNLRNSVFGRARKNMAEEQPEEHEHPQEVQ